MLKADRSEICRYVIIGMPVLRMLMAPKSCANVEAACVQELLARNVSSSSARLVLRRCAWASSLWRARVAEARPAIERPAFARRELKPRGSAWLEKRLMKA